ncbi:transposase [filamentous cyanobacterium CCP1]|nr:transposase [filamentous cyanobacterium CCP2]PSB68348.1 transposase [filamentous cyanobacterium CCP1]
MSLNAQLIEKAMAKDATCIGGMDCSFIPKSGKATYGLDWFYNGSQSRTQKGLEISVIAVIDVEAHRGYSLSVKQTPGNLAKRKAKAQRQRQRIGWATVEQTQQMLDQLPNKTTAEADANNVTLEMTRMDYYLKHLQDSYAYLPTKLKYWAVDGFYSKKKFVDGVVGLNLHVISKLRSDADMRYLYTGVQKPRGAKRKYDGKVELSDLSRFTYVKQLEPQLNLYTTVVWHVSLKRNIRIAALIDTRKVGKTGVALLFSTDVELDAELIAEYYKARFQIEFIFRDAKQFTGLCDAQTRQPQTLDFHFNASLTVLNLAKYEDQLRFAKDNQTQSLHAFSMASYKRLAFNDHLLERFISMLDLNPTLIKSHPNYQNLRSYGIIAI